jgi:hypothetical protein
MTKTATRVGHSRSAKIRELGELLCGLKLIQRLLNPTEPSMRLNDGWSPQDVERSWQEYGDGGDSWWAGAS